MLNNSIPIVAAAIFFFFFVENTQRALVKYIYMEESEISETAFICIDSSIL